MFRDYGLSVEMMPKAPPPHRSSGYGAILDWVTGTSWEMDEHVSLAIDIWRGMVDPLNYIKGDRTQNPAASRPSNAPADAKVSSASFDGVVSADDLFSSPAPRAAPQPAPARSKPPAPAASAVPQPRARRRGTPGPGM